MLSIFPGDDNVLVNLVNSFVASKCDIYIITSDARTNTGTQARITDWQKQNFIYINQTI